MSIYVRHDIILQNALTCFDIFMKMQGQKGKCKDDIKSYSLDRFEQVERSKRLLFNHFIEADHVFEPYKIGF